MDGISAAASVTALIDISATVASCCYAYSVTVKNAKKDIDRLARSVTDIKTVLEEVDQLFKTHGKTRLSTIDELSDTFKACRQQLEELDTRLKPRKGHRAMHRFGLRALSWPFTSKQVEEMIKSLQNYQQTFSLAIQIDQTALILNIDKKLNLPNLPFAEGASFNSHREEHNSKCLANTRVDLLHRIEEWAKGKDGKPIFWLNGMAGTGKSTIARTVAQSFADSGQLGGSFFFKKGEGDRGHAARFFTTLTRHLAAHIPEMAPGICKAVDTDPTISEKALPLQFEKLILQPLSQAFQTLSRDVTLIIVVDALDECDSNQDIRTLLYLLSQTQGPRPVTFRLFVTSRPELPIRLEFKKMSDGTYQDLILHEVASHVIKHDIDTYFQHELSTIREQRLLPASWPMNDQIQALVDMAVPLFIFAATTCRYIGDERDNPRKRLNDILAYQAGSSITQLDRIYLPILEKLFLDDESDGEVRQRRVGEFRDVVGAIVTLESPLSILSLACLLDIPEEDVRCQLTLLHSVLSVPAESNMPITLLHLSFRDFLHDPRRGIDSPFYVDQIQIHRNLAERCIHLMSASLRQDICDVKAPGLRVTDVASSQVQQRISPEAQYACIYWVQHHQKGGIKLCDEDKVHQFLKEHFLHWLEALSWIRRISDGITAITSLQSIIKDNDSSQLSEFIYDMRRFVLYNRLVIEQAPLQAYCSALVFSPIKSIVKKQFQNLIPQWMQTPPKVGENWNALLQTLEGHTSSVMAVAFSSDGAVLASASHDHTVQLWNTATGAVRSTLKGHTSSVMAVVFSPDGAVLASGSGDHSIRLWDVAMGAVRSTLKGHTSPVNAVAFSLNGTVLASGSGDRSVRLWDVATGAVRSMLEGHADPVNAVAFSPNGTVLASGSGDHSIRLWDVATRTVRSTLKGHTSSVNAVAFSPNGAVLASGSDDYSIQLWDVATGTIRSTLEGHTSLVNAVTFSPDGTVLVSGSYDHTVQLWDTATGTVRSTLKDHTSSVMAVAFSPNGAVLASGSGDRSVRLWDIATGIVRSTLEGHTSLVEAVTFSPDGAVLASASHDHTVQLWNTATGTVRSTLEGHADPVNAVAFSPDSSVLASGSSDRSVQLWDVVTGAVRSTLKGHTSLVLVVAFSPDGMVLASGSYDHTVRLWDVATGAVRSTLKDHTSSIRAVTFSPDSAVLASGSSDRSVRLWDVATGAVRLTLEAHTSPVMAVAFSPNGAVLASGSGDCSVRLWDAATGVLRSTLNINGVVRRLSFSDDEVFVLTDRGSLPLTTSRPAGVPSQQLSSKHIFVEEQWLIWQEERMLWLPPEHRPYRVATSGGLVALGYKSGRVSIMEFAFSA